LKGKDAKLVEISMHPKSIDEKIKLDDVSLIQIVDGKK